MVKKRIFIDGDSGTTGLDIMQRLRGLAADIASNHDRHDHGARHGARHQPASIDHAGGHETATADINAIDNAPFEVITLPPELRRDKKHRYLNLNDCDLAILCLPDDAAGDSVAMVENPSVKIIDCSTLHRTAPGWTYGLPEYNDRQPNVIAKSMRVTNPGCYPTGAILLLAPLVRAGLIDDDYPITVIGLSGYSGGGKNMIAEYQGTAASAAKHQLHGHLYGFQQNHKHLAEMTDYSLLTRPPIFLPMVGCFARGMVITIPLDRRALKKNIDRAVITDLWRGTYQGQEKILLPDNVDNPADATPNPVVTMGERLLPDGFAGRDDIELMVGGDRKDERLLLVARYDNLGKGAGGAVMQNLRLMLGL